MRKLKHVRRRCVEAVITVALPCFIFIIRCCPLSVLRGVARVGGFCLASVPSQRRLLLANLRIVNPDGTAAERLEIARASMASVVGTFLEFIWVLGHLDRLPALVDFEAEQQKQLQELMGERGVIIISPHVGNWEIGHLMLNHCGFESSTVARKATYRCVERLIFEGRSALGAEILHEAGAAKGMMRALKRKRCVLLLIDQNTRPHEGGVFVPFYGLPVAVSRAPAMFARRAKTPVVLMVCVRQPTGRFKVESYPLPKLAHEYPSDEALLSEIMAVTERIIERYPEQYLWLYRRWRYIPPEETQLTPQYPYYAKTYVDYRRAARDNAESTAETSN